MSSRSSDKSDSQQSQVNIDSQALQSDNEQEQQVFQINTNLNVVNLFGTAAINQEQQAILEEGNAAIRMQVPDDCTCDDLDLPNQEEFEQLQRERRAQSADNRQASSESRFSSFLDPTIKNNPDVDERLKPMFTQFLSEAAGVLDKTHKTGAYDRTSFDNMQHTLLKAADLELLEDFFVQLAIYQRGLPDQPNIGFKGGIESVIHALNNQRFYEHQMPQQQNGAQAAELPVSSEVQRAITTLATGVNNAIADQRVQTTAVPNTEQIQSAAEVLNRENTTLMNNDGQVLNRVDVKGTERDAIQFFRKTPASHGIFPYENGFRRSMFMQRAVQERQFELQNTSQTFTEEKLQPDLSYRILSAQRSQDEWNRGGLYHNQMQTADFMNYLMSTMRFGCTEHFQSKIAPDVAHLDRTTAVFYPQARLNESSGMVSEVDVVKVPSLLHFSDWLGQTPYRPYLRRTLPFWRQYLNQHRDVGRNGQPLSMSLVNRTYFAQSHALRTHPREYAKRTYIRNDDPYVYQKPCDSALSHSLKKPTWAAALNYLQHADTWMSTCQGGHFNNQFLALIIAKNFIVDGEMRRVLPTLLGQVFNVCQLDGASLCGIPLVAVGRYNNQDDDFNAKFALDRFLQQNPKPSVNDFRQMQNLVDEWDDVKRCSSTNAVYGQSHVRPRKISEITGNLQLKEITRFEPEQANPTDQQSKYTLLWHMLRAAGIMKVYKTHAFNDCSERVIVEPHFEIDYAGVECPKCKLANFVQNGQIMCACYQFTDDNQSTDLRDRIPRPGSTMSYPLLGKASAPPKGKQLRDFNLLIQRVKEVASGEVTHADYKHEMDNLNNMIMFLNTAGLKTNFHRRNGAARAHDRGDRDEDAISANMREEHARQMRLPEERRNLERMVDAENVGTFKTDAQEYNKRARLAFDQNWQLVTEENLQAQRRTGEMTHNASRRPCYNLFTKLVRVSVYILVRTHEWPEEVNETERVVLINESALINAAEGQHLDLQSPQATENFRLMAEYQQNSRNIPIGQRESSGLSIQFVQPVSGSNQKPVEIVQTDEDGRVQPQQAVRQVQYPNNAANRQPDPQPEENKVEIVDVRAESMPAVISALHQHNTRLLIDYMSNAVQDERNLDTSFLMYATQSHIDRSFIDPFSHTVLRGIQQASARYPQINQGSNLFIRSALMAARTIKALPEVVVQCMNPHGTNYNDNPKALHQACGRTIPFSMMMNTPVWLTMLGNHLRSLKNTLFFPKNEPDYIKMLAKIAQAAMLFLHKINSFTAHRPQLTAEQIRDIVLTPTALFNFQRMLGLQLIIIGDSRQHRQSSRRLDVPYDVFFDNVNTGSDQTSHCLELLNTVLQRHREQILDETSSITRYIDISNQVRVRDSEQVTQVAAAMSGENLLQYILQGRSDYIQFKPTKRPTLFMNVHPYNAQQKHVLREHHLQKLMRTCEQQHKLKRRCGSCFKTKNQEEAKQEGVQVLNRNRQTEPQPRQTLQQINQSLTEPVVHQTYASVRRSIRAYLSEDAEVRQRLNPRTLVWGNIVQQLRGCVTVSKQHKAAFSKFNPATPIPRAVLELFSPDADYRLRTIGDLLGLKKLARNELFRQIIEAMERANNEFNDAVEARRHSRDNVAQLIKREPQMSDDVKQELLPEDESQLHVQNDNIDFGVNPNAWDQQQQAMYPPVGDLGMNNAVQADQNQQAQPNHQRQPRGMIQVIPIAQQQNQLNQDADVDMLDELFNQPQQQAPQQQQQQSNPQSQIPQQPPVQQPPNNNVGVVQQQQQLQQNAQNDEEERKSDDSDSASQQVGNDWPRGGAQLPQLQMPRFMVEFPGERNQRQPGQYTFFNSWFRRHQVAGQLNFGFTNPTELRANMFKWIVQTRGISPLQLTAVMRFIQQVTQLSLQYQCEGEQHPINALCANEEGRQIARSTQQLRPEFLTWRQCFLQHLVGVNQRLNVDPNTTVIRPPCALEFCLVPGVRSPQQMINLLRNTPSEYRALTCSNSPASQAAFALLALAFGPSFARNMQPQQWHMAAQDPDRQLRQAIQTRYNMHRTIVNDMNQGLTRVNARASILINNVELGAPIRTDGFERYLRFNIPYGLERGDRLPLLHPFPYIDNYNGGQYYPNETPIDLWVLHLEAALSLRRPNALLDNEQRLLQIVQFYFRHIAGNTIWDSTDAFPMALRPIMHLCRQQPYRNYIPPHYFAMGAHVFIWSSRLQAVSAERVRHTLRRWLRHHYNISEEEVERRMNSARLQRRDVEQGILDNSYRYPLLNDVTTQFAVDYVYQDNVAQVQRPQNQPQRPQQQQQQQQQPRQQDRTSPQRFRGNPPRGRGDRDNDRRR